MTIRQRPCYAVKMKTHGMSKSPEYSVWVAMKKRCYYAKTNDYVRYGGAGIKVCEEWRNSFEAFYAYMGTKPSEAHSIDRLDSKGNYEPGNVRWATWKEQAESRLKAHPPKPLIDLTCVTCKKVFKRSAYDVKRCRGQYCSNSCSSKLSRVEHFRRLGYGRVSLTCPICNVVFSANKYRVAHAQQNYCSLVCRGKGITLRKKL